MKKLANLFKAEIRINLFRKTHLTVPVVFLFIVAFVYLPLWAWTVTEAPKQIERGVERSLVLPLLSSDSLEYVTMARNFTAHGVFSLSLEEPLEPDTFRTPGYPFFIAMITSLFRSLFAVTFFQIFLSVGIAVFIYHLASRLGHQTLGIVGGVAFLLDPTIIFFTLTIFSDILLTFLIMLLFWLLFVSNSYTKVSVLIWSGIIVGLAALVKPIALYLILLIPLVYFGTYLKKLTFKKVITLTLLLMMVSLVTIAPWIIRNRVQTGVWGFSSVSSFGLYWVAVPRFLAWSENKDWYDVYQEYQSVHSLTSAQAMKLENSVEAIGIAKSYLLKQPHKYAWFHVTSSWPFFVGSGLNLYDGANAWNYGYFYTDKMIKHLPKWVNYTEQIIWSVIWLLALIGVFGYRNKRIIFLSLLMIFYLWMFVGSFAVPRMRIPAEPFLFVLVISGLGYLWSRLKTRVIFGPQQAD